MPDLTLDHVVIAVRDLDAATTDYEAIFGRAASWRGEHPKYGTKNTLFRISNTYVELLALGDGKQKEWGKALAKHLDERGEGVYALALGTNDIKSTVKEMRANGLAVADAADGDGVDLASGMRREWRNAMVDGKSTNGVRIFFIEHRSPADALPLAEPMGDDGVGVRRMDHAVVLSADMEVSRRLWGDALGVRLALDRTFPDRNARIMFFRLGDITIEISGGAVQTEDGLGKPDRFWGLAWGVDSIEQTCARLNAAGVETSGPRPGIKPGTLVATLKGAASHGVATLLIEHTPESFRADAREAHSGAFDNTPQTRAFTAKALDHIVISTPDLDATWPKWSKTLNLAPSEVFTPEGQQFRLAKLPAGNTFVELIQPLSDQHPIAQAITERGQGMYSIAIEVDDLDAAVADLRVKNIIVSDVTYGIFRGTRIARIAKSATNGVPIQLIQRS